MLNLNEIDRFCAAQVQLCKRGQEACIGKG